MVMWYLGAILLGAAIVALLLVFSTKTVSRAQTMAAEVQFVGPRLTVGDLRQIADGTKASPVGIDWFDRIHRAEAMSLSVFPDDTAIQVTFNISDHVITRDQWNFGWPIPWVTFATQGRTPAPQTANLAGPKWSLSSGVLSRSDSGHVHALRFWVLAGVLIAAACVWLFMGWALRVCGNDAGKAWRGRVAIGIAVLCLALFGAFPWHTHMETCLILGTFGEPTKMTLGDVRAFARSPDPMRAFASALIPAIERAPLSPAERAHGLGRSESAIPVLCYCLERQREVVYSAWSNPLLVQLLIVNTYGDSSSALSPVWTAWHARGAFEGNFWNRKARSAAQFSVTYSAIACFFVFAAGPVTLLAFVHTASSSFTRAGRQRRGECLNCGYRLER